MHIHVGLLQLLIIFVGADLLIGGAWRLLTVHLANGGPMAQSIASAMAFLY